MRLRLRLRLRLRRVSDAAERLAHPAAVGGWQQLHLLVQGAQHLLQVQPRRLRGLLLPELLRRRRQRAL